MKQYSRRKFPKDSSKRNYMTNFEKREHLVAFYYAFGKTIKDPNIAPNPKDKKERPFNRIYMDTDDPDIQAFIIRESGGHQKWWTIVRSHEFMDVQTICGPKPFIKGTKLFFEYGGDSKQFYIIPKKLTYGPNHIKSIKNFLHLVYTPYFLQVLYFARGHKDGDTAIIDMDGYPERDVLEIPNWYYFQTGYKMKAEKNRYLTFSVSEFHKALEERKWPEKNLPQKKL